MTSVQAAIEFLNELDIYPPMEPELPPIEQEELDVIPMDWESISLDDYVQGPNGFGEVPADVQARFEQILSQQVLGDDRWFRSDWRPTWDYAAWYQPIHYYGHYWGIYIKEQAIWDFALELLRYMPIQQRNRWPKWRLLVNLWKAAFYAYFLHEQYHHKVESFGFRLAVVTRQPLYHRYKAAVYRPNLYSDTCLEESLANADMYRRLGDNPYARWLTKPLAKLLQRFLKEHFPWEPPGYRMAGDYLAQAKFEAGENRLQSQIREASLHPVVWGKFESWDLAPRMLQSLFPVTSHIWTVVPAGSRSFGPTRASSPVGTCSTNDLVKWLKDFGYSIVTGGGRGSHIKLECPGYPTLTIPHDRDHLAPWIVKQALQALGLRGLGDLDRLRRGEVLPARGNR
jgi:hypothetical protein